MIRRATTLGPLLALGLAALAIGCAGDDDAPACVVPDDIEPSWIARLGCEHDYELLWVENEDAIFAHTLSINWLIDREDDDQIYFIDSVQYDLHYFFANDYLNDPDRTPVGTHAEFNLLNYRRAERRFILGKLTRYVDQGLLTLEFSAGDTADAEMIVFAFEHIRDAIYDGDDLVYRPVSADHEAMLPELEQSIPVIRTEDVFLGQVYQPLNPGVGYGTLRFRRLAELGGLPLAPTDLVVLDRVPNDIQMVAGIITAEFQTPLAHVNVLAKNRGTPNMALRDAWDEPALRALEGQLVRLSVTPQEYTVEVADPADAQAYWDSLRPSEPLVPVFDLSVTALQDVAEMRVADTIRIGAKAANMGELHDVMTEAGVPVPLPEAPLAIPFARYATHIAAAGVEPAIDALIADFAAGEVDPEELQRRLFDIRWTIYQTPVDPALLDELATAVDARWGADIGLRFRSSTNVEDLPDFSGAGLYTSAGAKLEDGTEALANAIKVVWASAWNDQAFVERDFYRVDHTQVRMGVLVHPAFEDELANGVAVTINEFAENRPAYYINTQVGEVSVTNPTGEAVPEQILYYTWYEEPEYEVITRSSLVATTPGWPSENAVLLDDELEALGSYLEAIHRRFRTVYQGDEEFAVDVEFKLAPGRVVMIKQARPFKRRDTAE